MVVLDYTKTPLWISWSSSSGKKPNLRSLVFSRENENTEMIHDHVIIHRFKISLYWPIKYNSEQPARMKLIYCCRKEMHGILMRSTAQWHPGMWYYCKHACLVFIVIMVVRFFWIKIFVYAS